MPSASPAPRPRPSAAVLRRRRVVAGCLAAAFLLLVGWGIGALVNALLPSGRPDAEPSAAPTPVSSPTPAAARSLDAQAGQTQDPASVESCAPMDLRLVAAADRERYAPGEEAVLRLEVTNLSGRPCRTDVGTAQQEFRVTDASEQQVMSTRVCQADPTHEDVVLEPRDQKAAVYRWNGRASSADCARLGPAVEPGEYRLTVTLGEVTSRPVALTVTDGTKSAAPASSPAASSAAPGPSATTAPASAETSSASPSASSSSAQPSSPAPRASEPTSSAPTSSPAGSGRASSSPAAPSSSAASPTR
ncbi:hypothetical protein KW076_01165 [Micrococcus porci]|uniref:hypothetical protein n=1 Tax=Micrococcus porci TaxID=2856555 RepID=UPI001CCC0F31|nr:hypothetical protein [Micrococcus porci]UBH24839.1 hypothetical protein KW076_01165 [Micrococcus porci]